MSLCGPACTNIAKSSIWIRNEWKSLVTVSFACQQKGFPKNISKQLKQRLRQVIKIASAFHPRWYAYVLLCHVFHSFIDSSKLFPTTFKESIFDVCSELRVETLQSALYEACSQKFLSPIVPENYVLSVCISHIFSIFYFDVGGLLHNSVMCIWNDMALQKYGMVILDKSLPACLT